MPYRIHIDIPIESVSVDDAQIEAKDILAKLGILIADNPQLIGSDLEINYRLGHDDDRQRSNYLDMDKMGHCTHKKNRVKFANG
jgi:hypothetical protein